MTTCRLVGLSDLGTALCLDRFNSPFRILVDWHSCTLPFGMLAMIWSSPPIASMILLKVLTYVSERRSILEKEACLT